MRVPWLLLLAAVLAAGALWLLLAGGEPAAPATAGPEARGGAAPEGTAPVAAPRPGPEGPLGPDGPDLPRGQADRWMEAPLALPAGRGPVTGADLLEAVRAAGVLRVQVPAEGDLEALRREVFEGITRDGELHHAVLEPLLRHAGWDAHVRYPLLLVRRRPPEPPPR